MNKTVKRFKVIVPIVIVLSLVFVVVVYAITVDGRDMGDWAGIPVIVDTSGDTDQNNDIVAMRAAYGNTDIHFRIDVDQAPPIPPEQGQIFIFMDHLAGGCDSIMGGPFDGVSIYDTALLPHAVGAGIWDAEVYWCGGGPANWVYQLTLTGVGQSGTVGDGLDIFEISVPLGDVQMPPYAMDFFAVYFDNDGPGTWDWVPDGPPAATLVELASLGAAATNGGVRVEWQTASEVDNAGFNVYRKEGVGLGNGQYVRLNEALIPAQGGPTLGASYAYDDVDVVPGTTYVYMLEDVDVYGQATTHGPVVVEVGEMPTAVEVRTLGASRAAAWLPTFVLVFGAVGLAWTWRRKRR